MLYVILERERTIIKKSVFCLLPYYLTILVFICLNTKILKVVTIYKNVYFNGYYYLLKKNAYYQYCNYNYMIYR